MTRIYMDLRGLFSFPVSSEIKPTGIARTTIEWANALRNISGTEFTAPGLPIESKQLLSSHPEIEAIGRTVRDEDTSTARFASWAQTVLPAPMSQRNPVSKIRRKIAALLIPSLDRKVTSDFLAKAARSPVPFVYFVPFVRPMPGRFPEHCVPVMNVFDIIPLLFKDPGFGKTSGLFRSIDSFSASGGRFIVNSKDARHALISMFDIAPERVRIVPLGVASPTLPLRRDENHGEPFVIYVCSDVQRRKNIPLAIRAFRRFLDQTDAPFRLKIVGGGTQNLTDTIRVNAGSWAERVQGTGRVTDEELHRLYSEATLAIYPSLYEGFGLPILEYMRSGIPVICSSNTSIPEVCGDAAIMVDPLDERALAEALVKVTSDESLRLALIEKGFARVNEFSWNRSAALLRESLMDFLSEGPAAPSNQST